MRSAGKGVWLLAGVLAVMARCAGGQAVPDWAKASDWQKQEAAKAGVPVAKEIDLGGGEKLRMVYIPPGSFSMGSPAGEAGRDDDEGPQHTVRITKGFYMAVTEVTQGQWQAIMRNNPSHFQGAKNPVESVSWNDCQAFVKKAGHGLRLPTEAEWEYACRAGTTTPFYFGKTISTDQANYNGNYTYGNGRKGVYRQATTDVGTFARNAWGLYDMHGNVWEWCEDWGDKDYYRGSRTADPKGPGTGESRVLRGGSWGDFPRSCRSADRHRVPPGYRDSDYGFRVLME